MQTFLPYASFVESAEALDDKRLMKQQVENLQIMKAILTGPVITEKTCGTYRDGLSRVGKKTPWYTHPAVAMWRRNPASLMLYHFSCNFAWTERGFDKNTTGRSMWEISDQFDWPSDAIDDDVPPFIGDPEFHESHRAILLDKDYDFYSKHGWSEKRATKVDGSYPYMWPTKHPRYAEFYSGSK